jgi:hypothetical protein
LLQAIYSSKTLFLLGTKEPSRKKRLLLRHEAHLTVAGFIDRAMKIAVGVQNATGKKYVDFNNRLDSGGP